MIFLKFIKKVLVDEGILQNTVHKVIAIVGVLSAFIVGFVDWQYGLILFSFILLLLTLLWAYRKWKGELCSNWITKHELEHGKLPVLPSYLLDFAINYTADKPIHKDMKVKNASAQGWSRLNPSQQDELLGLVEWLGNDPRDYLAEMKKALPPSGNYKGLHYKR